MKLYYLTNGESVHDQRFMYKLIEKGYDITLISYSSRITPTGFQGIRIIHHHPVPDWFPFSTYLNYFPFGFLHLRKLLKDEPPDILHAGWVQHYGFISALCRFHPLLIMPWGSDIMIEPRKSFLHRLITRYALRGSDGIACDAEFVKKEITEISDYSADKIIVFPMGIELNRFNPQMDGTEIRDRLGWEDKTILIMARNFKPVYGIEYFLHALPHVLEVCPDTRVILCGGGELEPKLREIVRQKNLEEYVHFAGSVANTDLPSYYNAADIYVSTSLSDGTSLALLEAMACGLPTVVTDVPAIMEWVVDGENGLVVPRGDFAILAEKLIRLLQDEAMQRDFSSRNLKIAKERADWDKNFEKLVGMYETLLRR